MKYRGYSLEIKPVLHAIIKHEETGKTGYAYYPPGATIDEILNALYEKIDEGDFKPSVTEEEMSGVVARSYPTALEEIKPLK